MDHYYTEQDPLKKKSTPTQLIELLVASACVQLASIQPSNYESHGYIICVG